MNFVWFCPLLQRLYVHVTIIPQYQEPRAKKHAFCNSKEKITKELAKHRDSQGIDRVLI